MACLRPCCLDSFCRVVRGAPLVIAPEGESVALERRHEARPISSCATEAGWCSRGTAALAFQSAAAAAAAGGRILGPDGVAPAEPCFWQQTCKILGAKWTAVERTTGSVEQSPTEEPGDVSQVRVRTAADVGFRCSLAG